MNSNKPVVNQNFFYTGGTVALNSQSYVERAADQYLLRSILDGQFCYILTARQMGKSSLAVRAQAKLKERKYKTAFIDITKIGSRGLKSIDEFYFTLFKNILSEVNGQSLSPDDLRELENWMDIRKRSTAVDKFNEFLKNILLTRTESPIVIFIDEIDSVLSFDQGISTDDFFAALRAIYNARANTPIFQRITFVLMGVATPHDLMKDQKRTPFNIGNDIVLNPFTFEEGVPLMEGLKHPAIEDPGKTLYEIIEWTNGQPFLTQILCSEVAQIAASGQAYSIEEIARRVFIKTPTEKVKVHFKNIAERIFGNKEYANLSQASSAIGMDSRQEGTLEMLQVYQDLLLGNQVSSHHNPFAIIYLKLTGLIREEHGKLLISNEIYKEKFDLEWVKKAFNRSHSQVGTEMQKWLQSNQHQAFLLRGEILEKRLEWAKNHREQLSPIMSEFLRMSQKVDAEEREHSMIARLRKTNLIMIALSSAVVLIGILFGLKTTTYNQELETYAERLENRKDSLLNMVDEVKKLDEVKQILGAKESELDTLQSRVDNYETSSNQIKDLEEINREQAEQIAELQSRLAPKGEIPQTPTPTPVKLPMRIVVLPFCSTTSNEVSAEEKRLTRKIQYALSQIFPGEVLPSDYAMTAFRKDGAGKSALCGANTPIRIGRIVGANAVVVPNMSQKNDILTIIFRIIDGSGQIGDRAFTFEGTEQAFDNQIENTMRRHFLSDT